MDSGMVVGVGFLLGKNIFLKKSTCYQRHSMILSTRSVEASHLSKRLMWRTTSTASYFLFFCFFKQKWKMFWLPKLPTSTSGDFPKFLAAPIERVSIFIETNGMCIAVQCSCSRCWPPPLAVSKSCCFRSSRSRPGHMSWNLNNGVYLQWEGSYQKKIQTDMPWLSLFSMDGWKSKLLWNESWDEFYLKRLKSWLKIHWKCKHPWSSYQEPNFHPVPRLLSPTVVLPACTSSKFLLATNTALQFPPQWF